MKRFNALHLQLQCTDDLLPSIPSNINMQLFIKTSCSEHVAELSHFNLPSKIQSQFLKSAYKRELFDSSYPYFRYGPFSLLVCRSTIIWWCCAA